MGKGGAGGGEIKGVEAEPQGEEAKVEAAVEIGRVWNISEVMGREGLGAREISGFWAIVMKRRKKKRNKLT